ncbi:MAG TPA: T9SS type A sorting domain-containing protein, partial [Tenuifilaceae bacterium]|nr:T9SS type A sorting domain-containing protein [Tenuifilaceae bacterium]
WNGITGSDDWINVTPTTPAGDHTGGGTCFVTNGNNDYNTNSVYNLTSPTISLNGFANCELTFWIYMNSELQSDGEFWDGGYIECFDGTKWTKIETSLPYDGPLSSGNPLAGELGWSPTAIRDWTLVTADISAFDENPDFRIRFRFGSDGAAVAPGWAIDDINITGSATCTPPADQATNFAASNETFNSIDISWNRGTPSGGDNVLVVAREISAEHTDPTKGESYIANSTFGLGDEIGTGNFVVYNGTGTNISVTNLNNVTTYVFSVYEYSSTESCYNLIELSGTGTTAPKTEPSSHVSDFATGIVSSSEIPLTWVDATSGVEPDGYLIFVNTTGIFSNPTNSIPVYDDIDLTDGSGAVSVEQGIQAYTFTGLNFSTHYYFKIYPYTNNGDLILYKTDGEVPTTDATTLIDPCSIPISDLTDYTETFDIPETLDCWEIIDNQGNDQVWEFGNISGVTFGDGNYAFLNSDGFGMSDSQNSDLVTPIFDFTSYEDVTISFTHYYRHNSGSSATFYYKINNGDWKKIQQWVATTDNPTNFNQVINALDGQSQVRFKFNYTGSWDYYWLVDDFSVSGTTVCTPPTNQATNFISTAQTENSLTISWTRGTPAGGDEVLVLARKSGAVNSIPENGETYTSNTEFGNGSLIGADNYVVYTGTGTSVTVENLSGSTTYYFEIYEYTNSTKCYLVPGLTGSATTTAKPEPTNHVSSFATGNVSSSEITLTWTDASGGIEPDGYLIKVNTTGTFADPTDTNPISDDLVFGDGSGAINIPQGTQIFTLTGLINSTQYFFKIYPYTNSGALINYKINEYPPEVNETTLSDPCVINLSNESYTEGFENVTTPNLPECTSIENTNGDAYQWITATTDPRPGGTKHLSIRWNSAAAMDDWFFSQPLLLDAGYEYNVSFWYRAESSSYVEKLEVMWGTSNSSASMTLGQIFDNSNITSTTYIQGQAIITPTSNGVYYIGWHGYSLADKYYLYIDDISVTKGEAVNIAPSVENPIADITENEGFVSTGIDLTNVFSDADSDELTFSAVAENETIVTVNIVGNTLTVTEVGIGTTNITVTADDGNGGTVDDVFSFTVNENSNNAPVVENTIPDETENEGFVSTDIDLTNVFADDDDDELSFSAISDDETIVTVGVTGSTLTVTEVGTGTTSITVTADDGKGGTADDTFNFTVNAVPEVENPIADITEQEGFTSTGIDLTNVFADDDDDELSFSAISDDETIVTVGVTGSTLTVTEVGTGTTSITVTADDGKGGTADDTFNFCVNAFGNNIPNVENPIVDIVNNEGFISINIDLTNVFADTDDDALTYSAISENEEIVAVSIVGSTLSISEVGIGTTTITVTANDGKGGTVSDTFSFTVNAIPYVANSILNITENEGFVSVTINLLNIFTDNDGDVLTYSAISENESIITVEVVEHTLFLTETSVGTASITVTANDGKGGTTSEVFNFTVNAIPTVENPVADIALEEGFSTTDIDLTNVFTDADGDVLSYSAVSEDELVVTVSVAGSTLTVTEVGIGATSITVTANDGNGGTVNDVFNFTVSEIPNSAPTVANPITDIVLEEGFGTTNVDLTNVFTDTDGDVLTYTAVSENETIVTVSIVGNALSVTEVSIGTSEITVTASDGNGGTVNESFSFTVSEIPNSAPTVANPIADISLEEGFNSTDIDLTNVFTDADGDVLSYSAVSENELVVTVSVAGNTLTVTEVGNGATSITVTANDSNGGTVNDVFSFTVNEIPNSAPTVANPITDIVLEEGFGTTDVDLTNVFADADGDVLSYSAASENELVVTVSVAGNTLTVTEVGIGAANITVTANDGNGGTVSDSFSFTLNTGTYIEPLCNFNMNIYPNPVNDILNIQLISISDNEINFEVFDIKGRKVLSRKFDKDSLNRLIQINVSDFSSGVYLIQLRSDKFTETIRFIKE